jgi:hypothetical protein
MVHDRTTNFRNLAVQVFLGSIALASVALAFLRPGSTAWRKLTSGVARLICDATATVLSVNSFVSSLMTLSGTSKENE